MPKLIPVADALSKPFWDAVNQRRLVLQHCTACDRLQYPPQQACQVCNSAAGLTWKEVEGQRPYRDLHRDRGWPPQPAHARSAL